MRTHINGLIGILKDAFSELAFRSVNVAYTDSWDIGTDKYYADVSINFDSIIVNPNNDKHGDYLTINHGFSPLQKGDIKALANGKGLHVESVERVVQVAVNEVCEFDTKHDFRSRVK